MLDPQALLVLKDFKARLAVLERKVPLAFQDPLAHLVVLDPLVQQVYLVIEVYREPQDCQESLVHQVQMVFLDLLAVLVSKERKVFLVHRARKELPV